MKRRFYIGILVAGLTLSVALENPGYSRIASFAKDFQQHFSAMQSTARSLGTLERLVYSLVLAKSNPAPSEKPSLASTPRT